MMKQSAFFAKLSGCITMQNEFSYPIEGPVFIIPKFT